MRPTDPDLPALSPRPFCGGPAMLIGHEEHWIECQECEANTCGYATEAAAVAAWNRRVVVAAIPSIPTDPFHPDADTDKDAARALSSFLGWLRKRPTNGIVINPTSL